MDFFYTDLTRRNCVFQSRKLLNLKSSAFLPKVKACRSGLLSFRTPVFSLMPQLCLDSSPTCVYVQVLLWQVFVSFNHFVGSFFPPFWNGANSETDVCGGLHWKKTQTHPDIIGLKSKPPDSWINKSPFPNCVWRGNCARRAAAGLMAGAKRVHFVQHTRRIWRADVLSVTIQLQTKSCNKQQWTWLPGT